MKCKARRCCCNISLDDGVHGIVVWDFLYALFVLTTTLSVLVQQIQSGQMSQSFADIITAGILGVRAAFGLSTCCHHFQMNKVKKYLYMRLAWDVGLVIFNVIMAALRRMPLESFLTKMIVLIIVDGYLNFIIYSYLS